jgi:precorrin-6B methylase 2
MCTLKGYIKSYMLVLICLYWSSLLVCDVHTTAHYRVYNRGTGEEVRASIFNNLKLPKLNTIHYHMYACTRSVSVLVYSIFVQCSVSAVRSESAKLECSVTNARLYTA